MKRTFAILLKIVASIFGLGLLLLGALIWWLVKGPVTIDSISPFIVYEMSLPEAGITTSILKSQLSWDKGNRTIVLHLLGVTTHDRTGQVIIDLPTLDIMLGLTRLLRLRNDSLLIMASHSVLHFQRWPGGELTFLGMPAPPHAAPPPQQIASGQPQSGSQIAEEAADFVKQVWWLGRLTRLHVAEATVFVHDWSEGKPWQFTLNELTLSKEGHDLYGIADLVADIGGKPANFTAALTYKTRDRVGALDWSLRDFDLSLLSEWLGAQQLPAPDFPLSADFHLDFGADQSESQVRIALTGKAGNLVLKPLLPQPLPLQSMGLDLTATLDEKAFPRQLTLNHAQFDFGDGKTLDAEAQADTKEGTVAFRLKAALKGFHVADLPRYWPEKLAAHARHWVIENIRAGTIADATLELTGNAPVNNLAAATIDQLKSQMRIEKGTLIYLKGLPPATDLSALMTTGLSSMDFAISGGKVDGITATPSSVHIEGLDKKDQFLSMKINLSGPLNETLRIIDLPPLGYASTVGLRPDDATGTLSATLEMSFPLLEALKLADVDLKGSGTLKNGANSTLVPGVVATGAALEVGFDKTQLTFKGPIFLNTVPATLDWTEHFSGDLRSDAKIAMTCDSIQAQKFGLAAADIWQGPAALQLSYRRTADKKGALTVAADLTKATFDAHRLNWRKPAGDKADMTLEATLSPGADIAATFAFTGKDADIAGTLTLANGDMTFKNIHAETFKLGANDLHADLARLDKTGWQGALAGATLDLSGPVAQTKADGADHAPPPLDLQLDLGRVIFGTDRALAPLKASVLRDADGWRQADLKAIADPGGASLLLELLPGQGGRTLRIETNDLGTVLKALDWTDGVTGGKLEISGSSASADPTAPLEGKIHLGPYTLKRAPLFLRLVNLLLLQGIGDLFNGDSTGFDRLSGKFALTGDTVALSDVKTSGSSVGFTLDGTLNLARQDGRFTGTVVPAYGINGILNSIPVIGNIFGGPGQGIFAVTYKMSGPLDNLAIDVNPASVLTPGFLRDLFFGGDDDGAPDPAPAVKPDAPPRAH